MQASSSGSSVALGSAASVAVAMAPGQSVANQYINNFAEALRARYIVIPYDYQTEWQTDVRALTLHWPNRFFTAGSDHDREQVAALLRQWQAQKDLRIIWVAHNAHPHDKAQGSLRSIRDFLEALDGIIHLSRFGFEQLRQLHPDLQARQAIIPHGDYRRGCLQQPQPFQPLRAAETCRLLFFGQIRPYKGLDLLMAAASGLDALNVRVSIVGFCESSVESQALAALAAPVASIQLDLRDQLLSSADLENALDHCHAVVLPYRRITHSGSALHALSRNRPVLAPAIGSLPELQQQVGQEWLHLYPDHISADVLLCFVEALRAPRNGHCPLPGHDWTAVSRRLIAFLNSTIQPA